MSMLPPAEPISAKLPHGLMATVDTLSPSPVLKAHRPALFLPQNHVRAQGSSLWAVTTLSQPVMPLSSALVNFFLSLPLSQIICFPGMAPMPPSRLRDDAMHVISGALRSSRVVVGPWEVDASPARRPIFLAFLRMAPWLSSALCPSRPPLSSHLLPASAPSKSEGKNCKQRTGAAWPLRICRIRGTGENGDSSKIQDLSELSRPLVTITGCPGRNSTLLMPPRTSLLWDGGLCALRSTPIIRPPLLRSQNVTSPPTLVTVAMTPSFLPSRPAP